MKLVPIDAVRPSTYNPRSADPQRLELVELSLRKLGFILPIYADRHGEILSGHQRHLVASRMGFKLVPVDETVPMTLAERKAVNIAFNRGTNDLRPGDTPESMSEALTKVDPFTLAAELPDKDPGGELAFPCMRAQAVYVADLVRANKGRWVHYASNVARTFAGKGIHMPVVCDPSLRVVNGIGRLQLAAERKQQLIQAVFLSADEAPLAEAMLNYLSMDFDIHTRYADLLRYNSFRRSRGLRNKLGRTFLFGLIGSKPTHTFDIEQPADRARWIAHYGRTVLDFGAGHLTETKLLRAAGVDCVPFEPYRLGAGDVIDKAAAVGTARAFLKRVAEGVQFDSIFLATVLNSVPFRADREHIVTILASLAGRNTRVYAASASTAQAGAKTTRGAEFLNKSDRSRLQFRLDYEPNITLADFSDTPKVQKYHTLREWYDLWAGFFERVQTSAGANNAECIAALPRPVSTDRLRAALEFEFDLPYPDGSRMGLAADAIAAFATRRGEKA